MFLYTVDVTPPTFPSCTANGVAAFVNLYDPVSTVMPMVTDNSRLVASLTTTMDLASPITASQIITWAATDAAGNSATCNSNVTVRGGPWMLELLLVLRFRIGIGLI